MASNDTTIIPTTTLTCRDCGRAIQRVTIATYRHIAGEQDHPAVVKLATNPDPFADFPDDETDLWAAADHARDLTR